MTDKHKQEWVESESEKGFLLYEGDTLQKGIDYLAKKVVEDKNDLEFNKIDKRIDEFCSKWVVPPPDGEVYPFINPEKELKQLIREVISEVIGSRKSVDELMPVIPKAMGDLASQVAFKEGYNEKTVEMRARAKKLLEEK